MTRPVLTVGVYAVALRGVMVAGEERHMTRLNEGVRPGGLFSSDESSVAMTPHLDRDQEDGD